MKLISSVFCSIFIALSVSAEDPGSIISRESQASVIGVMKPVYQSLPPRTQLVESGELIGATKARSIYNLSGRGYSVAVIDSGVDYTHPAFGGRVIAGYDFYNNDDDPMDDNGHGTHVAGIVAGGDATYKGVAPEANIIALKTVGADGFGPYSVMEKALQWILTYKEAYNIVSVNISIGSGNFNEYQESFLDDEFAALVASGVSILISSGNSFYTEGPGIAFPAASRDVISVGAVWDGNNGEVGFASGAVDFSSDTNRITSFTQRNANLSILAPGALLMSAVPGGGFENYAGTSMAAPMVAGAVVLLNEYLNRIGRPDLCNQSQLLQIMQSTGYSVIDGDDEDDNVENTGLQFKSLNLLGVLNFLAGGQAPGHSPATTEDELVALIEALIKAVNKIKGRLNGSEEAFIQEMISIANAIGQSVNTGLELPAKAVKTLRKIEARTIKLSALAAKTGTSKKVIKQTKSKVKKEKQNLSKLIRTLSKAF